MGPNLHSVEYTRSMQTASQRDEIIEEPILQMLDTKHEQGDHHSIDLRCQAILLNVVSSD